MVRRLLVALLLVALAILTVPPLRQRAEPELEEAGSYLVNGPLSPIVNPFRKAGTQSEIGDVIRELLQDRNNGYLPPPQDEFQVYILRRVEGGDGIDGWGTPYGLVADGDSVGVVSAGPDREFDTSDDIVVKIRFATPAYMRGIRRR